MGRRRHLLAGIRINKRPTNICRTCQYSWNPRGHNVSSACPRCGGRDVTTPSAAGCFVALGKLVGYGVIAIFVLGLIGNLIQKPGALLGLLLFGGTVTIAGLLLSAFVRRRKRLRLEREQAEQYALAARQQQEALARQQWEQEQARQRWEQEQARQRWEAEQRRAQEEQQRAARQRALTSKYGAAVAERVMSGRIWVGQRQDVLVESLGRPDTTKQRVLKTKTKEVWSYWPNERGFYKLKITLEDGAVAGWETLEGTAAPAASPMPQS